MDYKKRYEQALERAKKLYNSYNRLVLSTNEIEDIFPELRESEDERILRTLYYLVNDHDWLNGATKDEVLTWLEKQKDSVSNAKYIQDIADAFEDGRRKGEQKEQKPVDEPFEKWLDDWYQGSKELGGDVVMSEKEFKNWSRGIRNIPEQKPAEWSDTDNIGWDEAFACVTKAEKSAKNEEELQNAVTAEKMAQGNQV